MTTAGGVPGAPRTDFAALRRQLLQSRERLAQVREELDGVIGTGHADGGLVTAAVDAEGRLVDLRLDPSLPATTDARTLAELVLTAASAAFDAARAARDERLTEVTDGLYRLLGRPGQPYARD